MYQRWHSHHTSLAPKRPHVSIVVEQISSKLLKMKGVVSNAAILFVKCFGTKITTLHILFPKFFMDRLKSWESRTLGNSKAERLAESIANKRFKSVSASVVASCEKTSGMLLDKKGREDVAERANELLACMYAVYGRPTRIRIS